MEDLFYIKKFIRDDGAQLVLDAREIFLSEDNELLAPSEIATTAVEYTEADGAEMIRQKVTTGEQEINGIIRPTNTPYWELSRRLYAFFIINHDYKIVYKEKGGTLFTTAWGWMSSNIKVSPRPREEYGEWSLTITLGSPHLTEYAEDDYGNEKYAHTVTLHLASDDPGGEIWDKTTGLTSDNVGEIWQHGTGGPRIVAVASAQRIYPIWTVKGPCTNPKLVDDTSDEEASYLGTVEEGQTLVVDFAAGTARLNTALVTRFLSGSISLDPGDNVLVFSSDGGEQKESTLSWNNIIG